MDDYNINKENNVNLTFVKIFSLVFPDFAKKNDLNILFEIFNYNDAVLYNIKTSKKIDSNKMEELLTKIEGADIFLSNIIRLNFLETLIKKEKSQKNNIEVINFLSSEKDQLEKYLKEKSVDYNFK